MIPDTSHHRSSVLHPFSSHLPLVDFLLLFELEVKLKVGIVAKIRGQGRRVVGGGGAGIHACVAEEAGVAAA